MLKKVNVKCGGMLKSAKSGPTTQNLGQEKVPYVITNY